MMYDEDMVSHWCEQFFEEGGDIQEEIEDARINISNQRLWQKGCDTQEQIMMYEENIANLEEYIKRLEHAMRAG